MGSTVAVPLWIALPLGLLAAWAITDKLLLPAIRWFVAGQANRVIDELGVDMVQALIYGQPRLCARSLEPFPDPLMPFQSRFFFAQCHVASPLL